VSVSRKWHRAEPGARVNVERVFHALGDPTRRATLDRLSDRPHTVSELAAPLDISLTAVVQHLQVLEESGPVQTEKLGRVRSCRIATIGFSVMEQWNAHHGKTWERKLDRLGELFAAPEKAE